MTMDDPMSCLQTWRYAEMYACKALYEFADRFLKTRFCQLSKTTSLGELTLDEIVCLLDSEELAANEEEVMNSIVKWVNYSLEARKGSLDELLQYVRTDVLSADHIRQILVVNNLDKVASICSIDNVENPSNSTLSSAGSHDIDGRPGQQVVVALGAKSSLCYVPLSKEWCNIKKPTPRHGFKVAELDGLVYVLGGTIYNRLSLSVWSYNPETNQWGEVAPMLKSAASFGVASLNHCLYAVGGPKQEYTMQRYEPVTNSWCFVKPMQVQRDDHCVAALQNKYLFAIGGHTSSTSSLYSVERYDVHSNTWNNMADLNIGRIESSSIALGDKIYVVGGYGGANVHELKSCEVYHSLTNTWCVIASTVSPRRSAGIVVIGSKVHVFGGNPGKKIHCECYCERGRHWEPVGNFDIRADQKLQCCAVSLSGRAICRNLLDKVIITQSPDGMSKQDFQ